MAEWRENRRKITKKREDHDVCNKNAKSGIELAAFQESAGFFMKGVKRHDHSTTHDTAVYTRWLVRSAS